MDIANQCGWDVNAINYYVAEYTESSYADIYTLPEAYMPGLIEHIEAAIAEE